MATTTAPKITDAALRRMPAPPRERLLALGDGLHLRLYPSGRKVWLLRHQRGGHWHAQTLGAWPETTVAAARAKVGALNARPTLATATVNHAVEDWLQSVEDRYATTKNATVYARRLQALMGARALAQVQTAELVADLRRYAKDSPVAANRCLATWRLMFQHAIELGLLERNPLLGVTTRVAGGTEKARERVLSDAELRTLWACQHHHAALLRFLALTGLRISEAQAASHEDIEGDRLRVPDNKSRRPHWVHLTAAARAQVGSTSGALFPQARSATAVQAWLKRMGWGWTPHDLRRTFATRAAGLGIAPHVVEKLLNHALQGVAAIYNRHDYAAERVEATAAVTRHVLAVVAA